MSYLKFFDEVHDMQRFVRENIDLLGNYLVISEQLYVKNNETGIIDMLAVDFNNRRLVIVELKNEITTDKNVWQPLRYYDLVRRGEDDLKQLLISASVKYNFNPEDIDINAKLLLVVPKCNEQLLRTLSYFGDIDSEVIELRKELGGKVNTRKYFPKSVFHQEDLVSIQNKVSKNWSFEEYRKSGFNGEKIKLAERFVNQIKVLFTNKGYEFDVFFSQTKATITKNGKVWGHVFVKQGMMDYCLTVSFKVAKDIVINKNDFAYNPHIEMVDIQKNAIKFKMNDLVGHSLLNRYL